MIKSPFLTLGSPGIIQGSDRPCGLYQTKSELLRKVKEIKVLRKAGSGNRQESKNYAGCRMSAEFGFDKIQKIARAIA
ncbi:hypothetical protein [Microcoleus sp. herbarium12]|uniref:hypothetical protein n=1 Tax=Microcoleus sp. herbarium12 TaxID=3055437 RepID=UPI002FD495EA